MIAQQGAKQQIPLEVEVVIGGRTLNLRWSNYTRVAKRDGIELAREIKIVGTPEGRNLEILLISGHRRYGIIPYGDTLLLIWLIQHFELREGSKMPYLTYKQLYEKTEADETLWHCKGV